MIVLKDIRKIYNVGEAETKAVDGVNLEINAGEFVAIMGSSGSGKSTLLNIIGCMDRASEGKYYLDGRDVFEMKSSELRRIRSSMMSFVFQNFALMDKYTVYENIELPLANRKEKKTNRKQIVMDAAEQLGIVNQLKKLPRQLSGGQQQRVALARALASGADIILADEPTGQLDKKTGMEVMNILKKLNEKGKTIILVTHDNYVAGYAERIINISDGRVV